jgi:hypothetical protein
VLGVAIQARWRPLFVFIDGLNLNFSGFERGIKELRDWGIKGLRNLGTGRSK